MAIVEQMQELTLAWFENVRKWQVISPIKVCEISTDEVKVGKRFAKSKT